MSRFLLALLLARIYHVVAIQDLPTTFWTHVDVSGRVTLVRHEADGDWHVRLRTGSASVVAEIIPLIPVPVPRVGHCVRVRGIRRVDRANGHRGWSEIHPVESIEIVACEGGP